MMTVQALRWRNGMLELLDQRELPHQEKYLSLDKVEQVTEAIRTMVVRGAPAIGIAAAYGCALAVRQRRQEGREWRSQVDADFTRLAAARPTAVNLGWAVARMRSVLARAEDAAAVELLEREAQRIHDEDIAANRRMGELGARLIKPGSSVLTHCNAGALATGGYGTALGVVRSAYADGRVRMIYADETRPWLQGARLTAWELLKDGIPVTLLPDAAAASLMRSGKVGWVVVGADRVAANGDVANKIGTYALAVAARQHGVGFMVAAPTSTIDLSAADGDAIPIEERDQREVLSCGERSIAPAGAAAYNPVFDVTPAGLVDVLVTEKGVLRAPDATKIRALCLTAPSAAFQAS